MLTESMMAQWDHTSAISAMIANANRGKGKQPITPAQLNPLRGGDGRTRLTADNVGILKGMAGRVES